MCNLNTFTFKSDLSAFGVTEEEAYDASVMSPIGVIKPESAVAYVV